MRETHDYDDIIHLPRPEPKGRKPMSMLDRAAQFSPFAALTGYEAAIQDTARLTRDELARQEADGAISDEVLMQLLAQVTAQLEETTL